MNIRDILYFAPEIKFSDVDLNGPGLPLQFKRRMAGFYIEPAEECTRHGYAFAAGTLLVSCIDALAGLKFGDGVTRRFSKFAREELLSFPRRDMAKRFYEEFRNGLVHQATLKEGAQFSLDTRRTLTQLDEMLVVNPQYLAEEVSSALDSYVDLLRRDNAERKKLAERLREDLSKDFRVARGEEGTFYSSSRPGS
jgi:hypothetical protein